MRYVTHKLIIFIFLFATSSIFCQNMSFQFSMDSLENIAHELIVNENDEIAGLFSPPTVNYEYMYLLNFPGNGTGSIQGSKLIIDATSVETFFVNRRCYYHGDKIYIAQYLHPANPHGGVIISYDRITDEYWIKRLALASAMDFSLNNLADNLGVVMPRGNSLGFMLLDANDGHELWQMSFELPDSNSFTQDASRSLQIQGGPSGGYFTSWVLENIDSSGVDETFIMRIDANGEPIFWKRLGINHHFDQLYVGDDGIYLLGRTTEEIPIVENDKNLILAKLDFELNPIWAKVYYAEEFEFNDASLSIGNDGTLTLGYSTFGYFPTILAKLSSDGEIIWEKGYPLFEPELDIMSDGSLLMLSRKWSGTPFIWENIVAKTDTAGIIEGCPNFNTCLESIDVSLEVNSFNLEESNVVLDTLEPISLIIEPIEFSFSDYCEFPSAPAPDFFVPDTICVMDSVTAVGLANEHAHGTLWQLSGNGIDSTWADSLEFRFRFHDPGEYKLSQKIWYLGCAHTEEKNIIVLPLLELQIDGGGKVCDTSVELEVTANRQLSELEWSTGEHTAAIATSEGGTYAVSVTDGFCAAQDSTEVSFVTAQFAGVPPLILPTDTLICEQHLPFSLRPESAFSDEFLLNMQIQSGIPILLEEEGNYEVAVEIEECLFSEIFVLETEDCSAAVYLPNAFSPNGDGINDLFFPQGKNYVPVSLSVYDRWGGLVYFSEGENVSWDGADVPTGTFVFVFEYVETILGESKQVRGDVTVLR